jgi:hypothetical protein
MRNDLDKRRRVLAVTYQRYLEADLSWDRARGAARLWFPEADRPYRWTIGEPSSPVRLLYERRQRALEQFFAARRKLIQARNRKPEETGKVFLLMHVSN